MKTIEDGGVAVFTLRNKVIEFIKVRKLGFMNALEGCLPFRMYNFKGNNFIVEQPVPDKGYHLLLSQVTVALEDNIKAHGIDQKKG